MQASASAQASAEAERQLSCVPVFFFNEPATTEIYTTYDTLSLHDALPIYPHCYSICYLLALDDGGFVPFARFMGRDRLFELLGDSIYIQPREKVEEVLRRAMDELWAEPEKLPESEAVLATLKRLLGSMFPPGRPLPLEER